MRQSLNYYIILEISFSYFRNDFKFCLFGQKFFFSIFIDLFASLLSASQGARKIHIYLLATFR